MSDEYGVQGLNGKEIVDDILAQLRKRLEGDCSLRPSDSYSRGYSAKITYHVECYGLDKETVDGDFALGAPKDDLDAEVEHGKVEIEQEENLGEVRDRIANAKEDPQAGQEEDSPEEHNDNAMVRTKRKYTRKVQLASPGVIGGAEDFKE